MAERVAHCGLGYPRISHSVFDRLLQNRFMKMVLLLRAGYPIDIKF